MLSLDPTKTNPLATIERVEQATTTLQLQAAHDLAAEGKVEEAAKIYVDILKREDLHKTTQHDITNGLIKMLMGSHYSPAFGYSLNGYDLKQVIEVFSTLNDCSVDLKNSHAQHHWNLANEYKRMVEETAIRNGPKKNVSLFEKWEYSSKLIDSNTQEYQEAFRLAHLEIASQLGLATASYQLAEIYKENTYYFPADYDSTQHDTKAIAYAKRAQEQGDSDALFNLGNLFEEDSSVFVTNQNAMTCYILATKSQSPHIGAAVKWLKMAYEGVSPDHEKITNLTQVVSEHGSNDEKSQLADWFETRSYIDWNSRGKESADMLRSTKAEPSVSALLDPTVTYLVKPNRKDIPLGIYREFSTADAYQHSQIQTREDINQWTLIDYDIERAKKIIASATFKPIKLDLTILEPIHPILPIFDFHSAIESFVTEALSLQTSIEAKVKENDHWNTDDQEIPLIELRKNKHSHSSPVESDSDINNAY